MPQPAAATSSRTEFLPVVRLGLLALLVFACARIALPFVGLILWSIILAVMLYPLHLWLMKSLGNKWSATLIGVVGIALILVPTILVVSSMTATLSTLVSGLQDNTLVVPPPPPKLATLPVVGQKLTDAWTMLAANTPAALAKYGPTLKPVAAKAAGALGSLASAALLFILAFGIAAVFVAYAKATTAFARRFVQVIVGSAERGAHIVNMCGVTIRGVAVGIVGVAGIQSLLLGASLFVVGVPGAGLLTLIIFLLGIVQIPAIIVMLPIIAYVFSTASVPVASIFAVWAVVGGLSDNFLKPLMLGRGMDVPMPVILIGVIGGMIADGLLGLFVGPVVLAVGYVLFTEWLSEQHGKSEPEAATAP